VPRARLPWGCQRARPGHDYFEVDPDEPVLLEPLVDGVALGAGDGDDVDPEGEPLVDGDADGVRSGGEPARGVVSRPESVHAVARPATSASAQKPFSTFFIAILLWRCSARRGRCNDGAGDLA
jgi:hypothetical protein